MELWILGELIYNMCTTLYATLYTTLKSILSHPKYKTPPLGRSGIDYSIAPGFYIGETGLQLSIRVKQHKKAIRRGETERSAVAEHVWLKQLGQCLYLSMLTVPEFQGR